MNIKTINISLLTLLLILFLCVPFFDITSLTKEDGLVEYLSVLFWAFGLTYSILLLLRKKNIIIFIFMLVCFLSLGEEISWGQRIFNIKTPDFITDANSQSELNFHNLYILSGGNTWRHFFKTGEFDYRQIVDAQNIFRLGFVTFFLFFPLLFQLNSGARLLNYFAYYKPEKYFTLFIVSILILSFLIPIGKGNQFGHNIQEIREMSYALFIAMYLSSIYYSENHKQITLTNIEVSVI